MTQCTDCGARYEEEGDSCTARFDALLALDHSRQEPWGSRHGVAFAAFALQHPTTFVSSVDRAWVALYRIYVAGDRPSRVFDRLVSRHKPLPPDWNVPARAAQPVAMPSVTIADLGDFDAASYPERLDAWCRATLEMWGAHFERS